MVVPLCQMARGQGSLHATLSQKGRAETSSRVASRQRGEAPALAGRHAQWISETYALTDRRALPNAGGPAPRLARQRCGVTSLRASLIGTDMSRRERDADRPARRRREMEEDFKGVDELDCARLCPLASQLTPMNRTNATLAAAALVSSLLAGACEQETGPVGDAKAWAEKACACDNASCEAELRQAATELAQRHAESLTTDALRIEYGKAIASGQGCLAKARLRP